MHIRIGWTSFLIVFLALVGGLVSAQEASPDTATYAITGFRGKLVEPPPVVSNYFLEERTFSAALYPTTFPPLDPRFETKLAVDSSSFGDNSLRFRESLPGMRGQPYNLIPLSVDADHYASFNLRRKLSEAVNRSQMRRGLDPERRAGGSGVGFSIGLPKRLDRIFGEGGAGLKVSGYRRISFSGRSQWTDRPETDAFQQNKFPSLRMEQISRFDITGTIGTKISVKVSQDSQTDIPLANRIQIRYKGDEDDIIKSIEAGNTTLSLPNTQFVGYSSRIQGLFGLKGEAQLGSLTLTAIASQEKGSSERTSYTATGDESAEYIRDFEYQMRRIFDLGLPGELAPEDSIIRVLVYESISENINNPEAQLADLLVNPNDRNQDASENVFHGNVHRVVAIPETDYEVIEDRVRGLHYIVFNAPRSQTYNLGYYMVVARAGGQIDTLGDISTIPYTLKLLCRSESESVSTFKTWQLMWRNVYEMPRGLTVEDIQIKVFKGLDGSEGSTSSLEYQDPEGTPVPYIEILGLDTTTSSNTGGPDGLIDNSRDIFRSDWGLLIFPDRRPFDTDRQYGPVNDKAPELDPRVPKVYEYASFTDKSQASQYFLQLVTKTRSSVIRLNRANIIEGSERVMVDNVQLTRGEDYTVNYDFGQIQFIGAAPPDANADVQIEFEYAPFITLQKKSLFGMRAEYEFNKDFRIGSTYLFKSDKAQDRKPRVGEETARMSVFDADMELRLYPDFLTAVADAVPLVETESPSNLSISAEVAQSHPNPNVDNVAYVDDFETAFDQLSLGTSRTLWKFAPPPLPIKGSILYQRGQMLWHAPRDLIPVEEIYDITAGQREGSVRVMRLVYRPNNLDIDTTTNDTTLVRSWAGIIRAFNSRVDATRVQLFEVRAKAGRGRLHFDFGSINEDIDGDGNGFTEDADVNSVVSASEDVGLDGLADSQEPGYDPITNPDPNRDNWYRPDAGELACPVPGGCNGVDFDSEEWFYEFLNGTEGNRFDASVSSLPDKETLAGTFNTIDAYFSFVLDFQSTPFEVPGTDRNGWKTYRIPVLDTTLLDDLVTSGSTQPDWGRISHVRVWFESDELQSEPDTVYIADWYFVQSNWSDSIIYGPASDSSSEFVVAEISEADNADFVPPPNSENYRDPTTGAVEAQRALSLSFTDLDYRDTLTSIKEQLSVDRYSGYRGLEMYVYGNIDGTLTDKVNFFFRLGRDENNYYEYRSTIHQGWDNRNHVNIKFDEITALKDAAQQALTSGFAVDTTDGPYRVYGNPNLNEIRWFEAGIVNLDSLNDISGELWLDELRVTDVRRDIGTAARVTVTGTVADLLRYNVSYQSQDPYFRGLSSATRGGSTGNLGSGSTQTTLNYGLGMSVDKFLPRNWQARIPVQFNYSKSTATPLQRTNSDIVLPDEVRSEEETVSESRSLTVSTAFQRQGSHIFFNYFLNRLTWNMSYRRNDQRDVRFPYRFGENISMRAGFDLSPKKVPTLPILFWTKPVPILKKLAGTKLGLYPERWNVDADFARNLNVSDDVSFTRRSSVTRTFSGRMNVQYKVFDNLSASLSYSTQRNMDDLDLVNLSLKNPKLGLETSYNQRFSSSYDPKLFKFVTTNLTYGATYSDSWVYSNQTRGSTLSRNWGVSGKFDHQQFLGGKGGASDRRRFANQRGGSRRSGGKDQTPQGASSGGGRPFYDPPLAVLRWATKWIEPFSYSYSQNYKNAQPGMLARPSLKYRFGLLDEVDVSFISDIQTRSASEGVSYDLSSGFTLLGGITTTVAFKESITRDIVSRSTRLENTTTNWPDLSIRIQKFQTLPLLKGVVNKLIDVFQPRTGYRRSVKKTRDIDGGFLTSKTSSVDYSPLLQVNFQLFRDLSLTASYALNEGSSLRFNPTNGIIQSETNSTATSLSLTAKYQLQTDQGFSLPLFGRIKFRSTLNFDLNLKMNDSYSETSNAGGKFAKSADKSDFSVSPVVSYTFSQQIRGGLTLKWQDTNDNFRGNKSHLREVQLWTEIRF